MICGQQRSGILSVISGVLVNVDNFARAESDRMFAAIQAQAGGVNQWYHYRTPTPVDKQTVIRMNRDTLYSGAIVESPPGRRSPSPTRAAGTCR